MFEDLLLKSLLENSDEDEDDEDEEETEEDI